MGVRMQTCLICDRGVMDADECTTDDCICPFMGGDKSLLWMKPLEYYKDMELVYKPSIDRLRDDMKRIGALANQIYEIAKAHDYPVIDPQTIRDIETADAWYLGKMRTTEPLRPAAPATTGKAESHTDHPSRVWDRTCPACTDTQSAYDRVDRDYERKGD